MDIFTHRKHFRMIAKFVQIISTVGWKKTMDPRRKKDRDLSGHCKNCYGNSDKAARTGVRRKKRITSHRARREGNHAVIQIISAHDPDEVESSILFTPPLGENAKWPDTPMGKILIRKIREKIRSLLATEKEPSHLIDAFHHWCEKSSTVTPVHAAEWVRYLRAISSVGIAPPPKIMADDQRNLHAFLAHFIRRQTTKENQEP